MGYTHQSQCQSRVNSHWLIHCWNSYKAVESVAAQLQQRQVYAALKTYGAEGWLRLTIHQINALVMTNIANWKMVICSGFSR